jgi:hypothetical protein
LKNPTLGKAEAISELDGYGYMSKYDLHPAIIRTCKQICSEAYEVLYGENAFLAACFVTTRLSGTRNSLPIFALTRYHVDWNIALSEFPGMLNVRKWKVVVSVIDPLEQTPTLLGRLCAVLAKNPPQQLEVGVLVRETHEEDSPDEEYYDPEHDPISEVLSPIKMLRNIPSFVIKDTEYFEAPNFMLPYSFHPRKAENRSIVSEFEDEPALIGVLYNIVHESEPAEYPFEMLPLLIAYAQSFERFGPFKREMSYERHRHIKEDKEE